MQQSSLLNLTFIDLTHTLTSEIPQWDGNCGYKHHLLQDYSATDTVKFRVNRLEMRAGSGTHMDAPAHCFPGGLTIAELSLEQLITPCVVIDVANKASETYLVTPEDINQFESVHGQIGKHTLVMIYTGWSRFWPSPKYRNNLIFPSVAKAAAELLLAREIAGLGIDTMSADLADTDFPVHRLLLGAGKYLVENVANLEKVPPIGAYSFVLPLKLKEGTESPIRLIAGIQR